MIIYLHGFRSSPSSIKAQQLRRRMAALGLADQYWCEQLPPEPQAAIALAEEQIARCDAPPTLVGSSLGGYYATWLAERHGLRAVLVNPAVVAHLSLADFIGPQTNLYTGERFDFTAGHVAQLEALEVPRITCPERYLVILGDSDEVLDYRDALDKYAQAGIFVVPGGDHGLPQFERFIDNVLAFAGLAQAKK